MWLSWNVIIIDTSRCYQFKVALRSGLSSYIREAIDFKVKGMDIYMAVLKK